MCRVQQAVFFHPGSGSIQLLAICRSRRGPDGKFRRRLKVHPAVAA
jgi:hypothetical protein